jgi:hypothetical protein
MMCVDIGEISGVSVGVHFVSAERIIQSSSVIVGQVVPERYVTRSFSGELDNHHYNIPLSVEEKQWLGHRITGFFGLFPSSGILANIKHDVSETGSVSVLR